MNISSLGKRVLGAVIDYFSVGVIAFLLWYVIDYYFFFGIMSGVVIYGLYTILLQGGKGHATLGQRAMGICVVDKHGRGIDYGTACIRFISSLVSLIAMIGYFVAFFTDNSQTLHDKIADTYVVDANNAMGGNASGKADASIVGISGEKAGMIYPINGNGILIGRDSAACQIVILKCSWVSRVHCFVSYNPQSDMFIIVDRGSKAGTYTEKGIRIAPNKNYALKRGERFYIGKRQLMFEVK